MTRKEEREQAAKQSIEGDSFEDACIGKAYFIIGAEWADENPDEEMIAKYLYEKKGYPIDLNGNLPSFDETMKATEEYLKYKQDKFIEKAIKFFAPHIQDNSGGYDREYVIENFRNYIKGE